MNNNNEFLLEFFSEEIPAKFHEGAIEDAQKVFKKILKTSGVKYSNCEAFVSPRRLTLLVNDMLYDNSGSDTKRGPKIDAKQEFIDGFLRANGAVKEDMIVDGDYYYLKIAKKDVDIRTIIQSMIEKFIELMPWKKSMRWYLEGEAKLSSYWIRPVRSVLCIYNRSPMDIYLKEFGITASNKTYGHRFLTGSAEITVNNFADYSQELEKNYVLIDFYKKRTLINDEIKQIAVNMGGVIEPDEELLDEVAGLVEYPFIYMGQIDEKFMHLPPLFITTVLKMHQKFFSISYPDSVLSPFYVAITNVPVTDEIKEGLNKVTSSRLSDAVFFYKSDTDLTLDDFALRLSNIVFQEKLGTIAQKIARMMLLTNDKQEIRAISICKADLATEIVGEMPELQGKAGEIYAKFHGEDESVCTAIREHYQPNGQNDSLPTTTIGARISLFDKLDTLVGFFGVGIYPTGSKDQFALRRAAYCIVRLLCDFGCDEQCDKPSILGSETISDYIKWLIDAYSDQGVQLNPEVHNEVLDFIIDRLKVFIGTTHDVPQNIIDTVMNSYHGNVFCYKEALDRCKNLNRFSTDYPDKFDMIKTAYKRAIGIMGDNKADAPFDIAAIKYDNEHQQRLQKELLQIHSASGRSYESAYNISVLFINMCDNVCIMDEDKKKCADNIALVTKFIDYIHDIVGVIC